MDTYDSDYGTGIIEIGGISHAGFYDADLQRRVMALDSMPPEPPPVASNTHIRVFEEHPNVSVQSCIRREC